MSEQVWGIKMLGVFLRGLEGRIGRSGFGVSDHRLERHTFADLGIGLAE